MWLFAMLYVVCRRVLCRSSDVISATVATLFQEFFKTNERSVFWDEDLKRNVEPFSDTGLGFWEMDWDLKVCLCIFSG